MEAEGSRWRQCRPASKEEHHTNPQEKKAVIIERFPCHLYIYLSRLHPRLLISKLHTSSPPKAFLPRLYIISKLKGRWQIYTSESLPKRFHVCVPQRPKNSYICVNAPLFNLVWITSRPILDLQMCNAQPCVGCYESLLIQRRRNPLEEGQGWNLLFYVPTVDF